MKSWKLEALILAIGMLVMGYFIKQGLDTFSGRDRVVNVKGLAEMEVPANKVTWPLIKPLARARRAYGAGVGSGSSVWVGAGVAKIGRAHV